MVDPILRLLGEGIESSVGVDDFEDPVCIVRSLGVVANITSQNTPF